MRSGNILCQVFNASVVSTVASNNTNYDYISGGQKSNRDRSVSHGVAGPQSLLKALGKNVSLPFPALEAACIPWLLGLALLMLSSSWLSAAERGYLLVSTLD